jgi:glycosyltransferase involved in cell wall biosynthesis
MSMAKPVIATAWGGPLDYLDPSCGVLVAPDSRDALVAGFAAAMVELAGSPATRERLGAAGLHKVQREFDWELKVDRMLALYADAMRRAGAAAARPVDVRRVT